MNELIALTKLLGPRYIQFFSLLQEESGLSANELIQECVIVHFALAHSTELTAQVNAMAIDLGFIDNHKLRKDEF